MDKTIYYNVLYDYYGSLLTDKQKSYYEDYYFNDLSLSEIAENENISRQGVHDAIKHAEQYLDEFEEKMGLFRKTKVMHDMINAIRTCTAEYREKYSYQKNISEYAGKILKIVDEGDELFG